MLSFHRIKNPCLISVALFFLSACAGDSEEPQLDISLFLSNSSEFLDVGQFQAAIIESRNAIQSAPGDARGHISLAEVYIEIGQPKEATKLLEPLYASSADFYLTLAKA